MNDISTLDAECRVGAVIKDEQVGKLTPYMFVDLGIEQPSFRSRFEQYQKLYLDAVPLSDGSYNYNVCLDTLKTDVSGELAFYFSVTSAQHSEFIEGCEETGGAWYLVFATTDAIEYLIDRYGNIVKRDYYSRNLFEDDD